jgi:hypothetical protein
MPKKPCIVDLTSEQRARNPPRTWRAGRRGANGERTGAPRIDDPQDSPSAAAISSRTRVCPPPPLPAPQRLPRRLRADAAQRPRRVPAHQRLGVAGGGDGFGGAPVAERDGHVAQQPGALGPLDGRPLEARGELLVAQPSAGTLGYPPPGPVERGQPARELPASFGPSTPDSEPILELSLIRATPPPREPRVFKPSHRRNPRERPEGEEPESERSSTGEGKGGVQCAMSVNVNRDRWRPVVRTICFVANPDRVRERAARIPVPAALLGCPDRRTCSPPPAARRKATRGASRRACFPTAPPAPARPPAPPPRGPQRGLDLTSPH